MRKGNMTMLASVLAIVLVAMGIGAGSMAYFSDTATSENTVFTAGTMEVQVGTVSSSVSSSISNLEPGDTITGSMTVSNTGSLDGDLWGRTMYTDVWTPGGYCLSNKLMLISLSIGGTPVWEPDPPLALSAYGNGAWQPFGSLNQGTSITFSSESVFDPAAGNNYQNTRTRVWFEVMLTQVGESPP